MSEQINVFVINPHKHKQINVQSHDLSNIHLRVHGIINSKCSKLTHF